MEPLEFKAAAATGIFDHAGNGQRIVSRKLRIKPRPYCKQPAHAVKVAKVGHRLACKHWVIGKTALLPALHLGVPISAFDETDHQSTVQASCDGRNPVN